MATLKIGFGVALLTMLIACDQGNDSEAMHAIEETEVITNEVIDSTTEVLDNAGDMVEEAVDMAKDTAQEISDEAEEKRDELVREAQQALEEGEGEVDSVLKGLKK